jgi:hypothetical protein
MTDPNDPRYIVTIQTHIYKRENDALKIIARRRGLTKQQLMNQMIENLIASEEKNAIVENNS